MLTLAGEQKAYEILVARYERAVVAAARNVTGNQFMAEDAAQDAFVTAWMKLDVLRESDKYCAWVCRIAKNCAKGMVQRYRGFLNLDDFENHVFDEDVCSDPELIFMDIEERAALRESVKGLSEKVREIIRLHYFEGLSIADIAERLRVSAGTVKRQLHEGRKRIRKELCSVNEELSDTLVQKVMKKVEELRLFWQTRKSKKGFGTEYNEVLRQVEELPESTDKNHALADVLMLGWWWLPGEKNDALFERICLAAEKGKNDDVMRFIVAREDSRFYIYDISRLGFVRDKQIPRLEKMGFVKTLGSEWCWLAHAYFEEKQPEKGIEAYEKALSLLPESDIYYHYARSALEMDKYYYESYVQKNKKSRRHSVLVNTEVYRITEDGIRRTDYKMLENGELRLDGTYLNCVLRSSSRCDCMFTAEGLSDGEVYTGSDGTTLKRTESNAVAVTPAGSFEGCQVWVTECDEGVYTTYYKEGVGIVRHEKDGEGIANVCMLKSYHIEGGEGLIPLHKGNTSEYTRDFSEDIVKMNSKLSVAHKNDDRVIFVQQLELERLAYDESSWDDMMLQIRNDYFCDGKVCDVSYPIKRAEELAATPLQKAHTISACSVARRILATDPDYNPDYTERGHWNFFGKDRVLRSDRGYDIKDDFRSSFELKYTDGGLAQYPILYNDIYGILRDAAGYLWSDSWIDGAEYTEEHLLYDKYCVQTQIRCEKADPVTTKAGTFEDCIRISFDSSSLEDGLKYRCGKRDYYFARGVGIVRVVNPYLEGAGTVVYELSSYEGTGDGYMPFCPDLVRRYDALELTDGYYAGAEYRYACDKNGRLFIFSDRWGCRRKNTLRLTDYSEIYGEQLEKELWWNGKRDESRMRHAVNNLRLIQHFLSRDSRNWAKPEMAVDWLKYTVRIIDLQRDEAGGLPRAWLGAYAAALFAIATASFGCGRKEEAYEYLDRSFDLLERWFSIPDGEMLELGGDSIYGGIKLVKGKNYIELPDGTREVIDTEYFKPYPGHMYYGMTAKQDWQWFDPVRGEERFKEATERARLLFYKYK